MLSPYQNPYSSTSWHLLVFTMKTSKSNPHSQLSNYNIKKSSHDSFLPFCLPIESQLKQFS